ncbi:MAG: AraC family transcriptional regulator [Clostridia bacterium]|nr:AraC family transcriptional regulator [Clostridia bacterium]
MRIKNFAEKYKLKILTDQLDDRDFNGVYISDLLSYAIANVQKDNLWITIQDNINIVAIASLKECPVILIAENNQVSESVITKAVDEDIMLVQTEKKIYELCEYLILESSGQ